MNDDSSAPADDAPDSTPDVDSSADSSASAEPIKTNSGIVLRDPKEVRVGFYGRYAFLVFLMPFVIYMIAVMTASWRDGIRHDELVKRYIVAMVQYTREQAAAEGDSDTFRAPQFWEADASQPDAHTKDAHDLIEAVKKLAKEVKETAQMPLSHRVQEQHEREFQFIRTAFLEYLSGKARAKPNEFRIPADFALPDDDALFQLAERQLAGDATLPSRKSDWPKYYTIGIALTALYVLFALPGMLRVPFSLSWWSVAVGVVGIFVWVGLAALDRAIGLGAMLGLGVREGFDPFTELAGDRTWMFQFLAIRFFGLVLIVPLVEEFFIRGFLFRYVEDPDWDLVPYGVGGALAVGATVLYGPLAHAAEPLAALAWFGMMAWLYWRTRSIWDCVLAHAITNLLLGLYVVWTGTWELW